MKKYILQFCLLLTLLCPVALRANGYVIINQVMYDTPLSEVQNAANPGNGEFIELYNAGTKPVNLNGWTLLSLSGKGETLTFPNNTTIQSGGYLLLARRNGKSNTFAIDGFYTISSTNVSILYQNQIALANEKETLVLLNANKDTVDYIYYDGDANKKNNPGRLHAENATDLECANGDACVSLHRTWVEFDGEGHAIPAISKWETNKVSFGSSLVQESSYYEDYLLTTNDEGMGQTLPTGENYVITITPLNPTSRIDIENGRPHLSSAVRTRTSIQYMDGLGRAEETIALGITPDGKDLVSVAEYYGKKQVSRQWLPIEMQTEGQRIDLAAVKEHAIADYGDASPYAETRYDKAAHKVEQTRPGKDYQKRPKKEEHGFNAVNEVRNFIVSDMDGSLRLDGYYAVATLHKTTVTDEDGHSVVTYTDKQGRKIMDLHGTSEVYYVYDNLGRLRYMLPNISGKIISGDSYRWDNEILKAAAYCYNYDKRGNMICKRLPGCEPQYMVYDIMGQLVLKQDGNQRKSNKWTLCSYDDMGRNVYLAEVVLSQQLLESLVSMFANEKQVGEKAMTLLGLNSKSMLIENFYDTYDNVIEGDLAFKQEAGYEKKSDNTIGLLTGTRVYNLSEKGYTTTVNYYDTKGRVIQSRSRRSADGRPTVSNTLYNFDGSVAQTLTVQGSGKDQVTEQYRYTYDHAGRAQRVYYKLNNQKKETTLSEFSYDKLGHLAQNLLCNQQDKVDYTYDMRGMLTSINNKNFSERLYYADNLPTIQGAQPTACYNGNIAASIVSQYNSQPRASSYSYDSQNRLLNMQGGPIKESFTYDNTGNILSIRRENFGRVMDDLRFGYDNDGNKLLAVQDLGNNVDRPNCIEYHNMSFGQPKMYYDANGNLVADRDRDIRKIDYNVLNLPTSVEFSNGEKIVNYYNAAGQKYKSITYSIPQTVSHPSPNVVSHLYAVDSMDYHEVAYYGNVEVHKKRVGNGITTYTTIHNSIGYVNVGYPYFGHLCYYIKDHLGNNCVVVNSATGKVEQNTAYYATGVPTQTEPSAFAQNDSRGVQPYLYNGKEFVETPSNEYNVYDYGFRGYYATIGRFTSMDPLCEQTPWQSPYAYAGNNFVNCIDYMGLMKVGPTTFTHAGGSFGPEITDIFGGGLVGGITITDEDFWEAWLQREGIDLFSYHDSFGGGGGGGGFGITTMSGLGTGILGGGPQVLNYIVIDSHGNLLGGENNDDNLIYLDESGKWKPGDGVDGLEPVGNMMGSYSDYMFWIGIGHRAPGLYWGQYSVTVSVGIGIQYGFATPYGSMKGNFLSLEVFSYTHYLEKGKNDVSDWFAKNGEARINALELGIGQFGCGYSTKFELTGEMRAVPGTHTSFIKFGPFSIDAQGYFSYSYSIAYYGSLTVTISGNAYYGGY